MCEGISDPPAGKSWEEWQASGSGNTESVVADPMFADPASGISKWRDARSPVWKLGWKAINMSTVGPR